MGNAKRSLWAGNIRELKNRVEKAFLLRNGDVVELQTNEQNRSSTNEQPHGLPKWLETEELGSLDTTLKRVERELIDEALQNTSGNISRAAKLLGMSRPRLSQKVKEYGLKKGEKREN